MKTYPEFIELVAQVRDLQKRYFKTRDPKILQDCKVLERYLDNLITVFQDQNKSTQTLF